MQAFSVSMIRRHARTHADDNFHYGPAVRVVSGNHVTGKRRGVVDGVDFGATGSGEDDTTTCTEQSMPLYAAWHSNACKSERCKTILKQVVVLDWRVLAVRFVQSADIADQLARGHLVLLSNLAYSAAGEPLNCNTYDVATHAAIELKVGAHSLLYDDAAVRRCA